MDTWPKIRVWQNGLDDVINVTSLFCKTFLCESRSHLCYGIRGNNHFPDVPKAKLEHSFHIMFQWMFPMFSIPITSLLWHWFLTSEIFKKDHSSLLFEFFKEPWKLLKLSFYINLTHISCDWFKTIVLQQYSSLFKIILYDILYRNHLLLPEYKKVNNLISDLGRSKFEPKMKRAKNEHNVSAYIEWVYSFEIF